MQMYGVHITLRMRLLCQIHRKDGSEGDLIEVLNEVVVDRGANPYLTKIECWEHERLITKVRSTVCGLVVSFKLLEELAKGCQAVDWLFAVANAHFLVQTHFRVMFGGTIPEHEGVLSSAGRSHTAGFAR